LFCDFFMTFYLWRSMLIRLQKVISNKPREKLFFCLHLEAHRRKDQDPDPLVRGMDPKIRIRTKMSPIRNTAYKLSYSRLLWMIGTVYLLWCLHLLNVNKIFSDTITFICRSRWKEKKIILFSPDEQWLRWWFQHWVHELTASPSTFITSHMVLQQCLPGHSIFFVHFFSSLPACCFKKYFFFSVWTDIVCIVSTYVHEAKPYFLQFFVNYHSTLVFQ
jgi:hypothetical protein